MAVEENKPVSFEDHTRVQQELDRERERARRNEAQLVDLQKKFEAYKDIDPEKYKGILEDYNLLKKQGATTPEKVDQLLKEKSDEYAAKEAKLRKDVQAQLDAANKKAADFEGKWREMSVTDRAMSEVAGDFEETGHTFVKDYIRRFVDLDDRGDLVVKDEKGEVRYSPTNRAALMSVKEFAQEVGEKHPILLKSKQVAGSMNGETRRSASVLSLDQGRYNKMSPEERQNIPIAERGKLAQDALKNISATAFMQRGR